MAVKFLKGIDNNNQRAIGVASPSAGTDAANKDYVDAKADSRDWKESVRAATTAAITRSGAQTIDAVAVVAGDRVLDKDAATAAERGIYVVAAGAWSRAADADISAEVNAGLTVTVEEGTVNGDKRFVLATNNPITLGTTALTFTTDAGGATAPAAGAGLTGGSTSYDVGAGTGITVTADAVGIDPNVVARKFAANCVGGSNPQIFAHGLGTADLVVLVREGIVQVFPDVTISETNVTVDWGASPTAGQYRVAVVG